MKVIAIDHYHHLTDSLRDPRAFSKAGRTYSKQDVDKIRSYLGTSYMMAMGVCGVVLTAIGSTLDKIAVNCGTTSTAIGSVFVARGIGAVLGAVSSATLYSPPRKGNNIMLVTMMLLTAMLIYLPFVDNIWILHIVFTLLGFCTAVTDTGCQIMSRKVHGTKAGPWLGANTVVFGVAGALVPLVDIITTDLFTMYAVLSTVTVITIITMMALPHPEMEEVRVHLPPKIAKGARASRAKQQWIQKYFVTEMIIGNMVFWLIGGKVLCSSYIEDYVTDSGVIASDKKAWALMIVWIFIAIGRFVGLHDQIKLNRLGPKGIYPLYQNLTLWVVCGGLGGAIMLIFMNSAVGFWLALMLYGFGNGPCVGYCYDLNNRLTIASEKGMSIVMFGLNFGASIVPYGATLIWEHTTYSWRVMPLVLMISMILPIPLLYSTRSVNDVTNIGTSPSPSPVRIIIHASRRCLSVPCQVMSSDDVDVKVSVLISLAEERWNDRTNGLQVYQTWPQDFIWSHIWDHLEQFSKKIHDVRFLHSLRLAPRSLMKWWKRELMQSGKGNSAFRGGKPTRNKAPARSLLCVFCRP